MNKLLKFAVTASLALSLPGCAGMSGLFLPASPAPLAQTTIDDRGLEAAWRAFDVALDAINLLGDRGVIVPGSPTGKAVASGIRKVNKALSAAERFAAAGSTKDYASALTEAKAGMDDLRAAMKGN